MQRMIGIGRVRFPFIVFADHGGDGENGSGVCGEVGRSLVASQYKPNANIAKRSEGQADQHGDIEGGNSRSLLSEVRRCGSASVERPQRAVLVEVIYV